MSATTAVPSIAFGPSPGRTALVLGGGVAFVLAAAFAAVAIGTSGVGTGDAVAIVLHRVTGIGPVTWSEAAETIVWDLRLPRVVAGMAVGAGLACAGAVFQALLRNPMADPYIIGPAAGASLGAVVAILLPVATVGLLGIGLVQLLAFAGGLLTVFAVLAVARGRAGTPVTTLLLAGYAVSSLLAAGTAIPPLRCRRPPGGGGELAARVAGRVVVAASRGRRPPDRGQLHAPPGCAGGVSMPCCWARRRRPTSASISSARSAF